MHKTNYYLSIIPSIADPALVALTAAKIKKFSSILSGPVILAHTVIVSPSVTLYTLNSTPTSTSEKIINHRA